MSAHMRINAPGKKDNRSNSKSNNGSLIRGSYPTEIIQRVRMNPQSLKHADVMVLQGTIGNQAVIQLLKKTGLMQGNSHPMQHEALPENEKEVLPGKFASIQDKDEPAQVKKENKTGLPDNLKAGAESLSGLSLDDVKVHYNSSKPAELGALAYTQGTNIHVADGQERHLPHETWHVVQQIQGRVNPTLQFNGISVNDNSGLELEASEMGEKALNTSTKHTAYFADKYATTEKLSIGDAKPSSAVRQLCPPRRAAFERNPFSHPPARFGLPSQSSMSIRNPRSNEGQRLEYTSNLLWDGFRSGRYPTIFTPETLAAVYQNGPDQICTRCGRPCTKGTDAQIDHITPFFEYVDNKADRRGVDVIEGVTWYGYLKADIATIYNDIDNLQILCNSCNASKGGQPNRSGYGPSTNPEE